MGHSDTIIPADNLLSLKIDPLINPEQTDLRKNAHQYLSKALDLGLLPSKNMQVVTVFSGGTSVVYKMSDGQSFYIVKMNPYHDRLENEAIFLGKWGEHGIKTPKTISVYHPGNDLPITILVQEYIPALLLSETRSIAQMTNEGISCALGETLAKMHQIKSNGYGVPISGTLQGEFSTIEDEIGILLPESVLSELIGQKILKEDISVYIRKAVIILEKELKEFIKPSLTHNDFRPYNVFATSPLTVFDPIPRISHPYLDLSLSLVKSQIDNNFDTKESDEILKGYACISPINEASLQAASLLKTVMIMALWNEKDKSIKVGKAKVLLDKFIQQLG